MLGFSWRKINPQLPLGIFLGLSVSFILHSQRSLNIVHDMRKQLVDKQEDLKRMFDPGASLGVASSNHNDDNGDDVHRFLESAADAKEHKFEDSHLHHDDDSVAQALHEKVRVLCWVMTSPSTLRTKAIHVRNTWARRCNTVLFMSSVEDKEFPAVGLNVTEGRAHLTAKTMQAFSYIYHHHLQDADWFFKADDDTYVVMENMRFLLSNEDPAQPLFFGHRFRKYVTQGYASGGGGYVISREALRRFGEREGTEGAHCRPDRGAEDVEMGKCLNSLGVKLKSSHDALGRSRFHCFTPDGMISSRFPAWYYKFDFDGGHGGGIENISDYAISFHYLKPSQMYSMEFFTYHLQPYGIANQAQDLNRKT